MSRTSLMTAGILLVLVGVQLNLVESYVLTPRATQAWDQRVQLNYDYEVVPGNYQATTNGYFRGSDIVTANSNGSQSIGSNFTTAQPNVLPYSTPSYQRSSQRVPAYQASYAQPAVAGNYAGSQKMVTPPKWFCWPPIFLGSVMFLFGVARLD